MITDNGKTIHLKRAFNVSVENLYRAWSDSKIFKAWWKDLSLVEMDFRVGGSYRLQWVNDPGSEAYGEYRQIVPHQKISFTWSTQGCGTDPSGAKDSIVHLHFTATGQDRSQLELRHELLVGEAAVDSHHLGWTCSLLDLDQSLNASTRNIREDLKVNVSREFSAPVARVWEAWTNPVMMSQWFNRTGATLGKAHSSLRVGRNLFLDFQKKDGTISRVYGGYQEIVPLRKLVFTWLDGGDCDTEEVSLEVGYESWVSVVFTDLGKKTRVELIQNRLVSEASAEKYREGWTDCLRSMDEELTKSKLAVYLSKDFKVPVKTLYEVCSSPAFLALTGAQIESGKYDFREGGSYDYKVKSIQHDDYVFGKFLRIIPEIRIEMTWNSSSPRGGDTGETLLTLVFSDQGKEGSRLSLAHTGFRNLDSRDEHEEGWTEIFSGWDL